MNNKPKKKLQGFTFILAGIFLLGFIFLGYMHEQVHVSIFKSYGIESQVEYFRNYPDITTRGAAPCPTDACLLAHNVNEAITYPLQVIYLVVCVLSIFLYEKKAQHHRELINTINGLSPNWDKVKNQID